MAKKQTRSQRKSNAVVRKAPSKKKTGSPATIPKLTKAVPLSPAWKIAWQTVKTLWKYRVAWLIVIGIYLALDLILVRSISVFDVSNIKESLGQGLKHGPATVVGGLSVFSTLVASATSGAGSVATGAYRFFLVLIVSLVVVWLLRQMYSRDGLSSLLDVRTAFYEGTTPFVPFVILLFFAGVQMLPLLIAMTAYSFMLNGGIANTLLQQGFLTIILFAIAFITVLWLVRTIMALYIVMIPGMLPSEALRNAKALVKGRRLSVMRKVLFLPLALFVAAGLLVIPTILIWSPLAQWLFFVLTGFGLVIIHTYLYTLYRELLREEA